MAEPIVELTQSNQSLYSNLYFMGQGPRAVRLKCLAEDIAFFDGPNNLSEMLQVVKDSFDFTEHMVDTTPYDHSAKKLNDNTYQFLAAVVMLSVAFPIGEYENDHQTHVWEMPGFGSVRYGRYGIEVVTFTIPDLQGKVVGHAYVKNGLMFKFDHLAENLRLGWMGYMFKTAPQGLARILKLFVIHHYPDFIKYLPEEVIDEQTQITNKESDAADLLNQIYEIIRARPDRVLDQMRYQGYTFCESMRLWFRPTAGGLSADSAHIGWCYWALSQNYQIFFNLKFNNFEPKIESEFKVLDKKIVNHFLLMVLYEITVRKLQRGVEHAKTFVYKPSTT